MWKYWETSNFKEQRISTGTAKTKRNFKEQEKVCVVNEADNCSFNPSMEIFYFFQGKRVRQYIILSVNKGHLLDFQVDRVKWFVTWSGKAASILVW